MKNSWLYKLIGAFLVIIAIGGLVTSVLTSRATLRAFNLYTTRSGQIWARRLAPDLAEYYALNNSWLGIDLFLHESSMTQQHQTMMGQGNGKSNPQVQSSDNSMMGSLGQRLILADAQKLVVYDSLDEFTGNQLSQPELIKGIPVAVDKILVGTLLVTPGSQAATTTLANEFQASVRRAIISSTIIAGITALALGALLFFQITAPMRKLRKAAAAIAEGDLTQRVEIHGEDEFAQLGETFNQMAANLSRAELHRQHLMADVAHELRTPLTAIQGTVEGMQDGVLPCDADQLNALLAETTLLNRLIEDLRLLSLAENNQLILVRQPVEINSLIEKILERIQTQAHANKIEFTQHLQNGLTTLQVDPDRITQILNNLINNALRYTPRNGTIELSTTQHSFTTPIIISVTDSGTGISAEDLPHVFDRFYRADKSRSRASGGSGLGLAIVKELVEAHGGTIKVESPAFENESHEGFGTRFILEFPSV
ncbi:MAG: HAMP domain-containing protein [Anaerolineae bacterium]|nr:HAMP domain-containing protein [Anaerolineae bacterium]